MGLADNWCYLEYNPKSDQLKYPPETDAMVLVKESAPCLSRLLWDLLVERVMVAPFLQELVIFRAVVLE